MISPETRVQIRRYYYAEHWKVGTIASELGVHPDAVRNAIESNRFATARPLRDSILDPAAQVAAGYQPIMPSFAGLVSEEQILDLIAYIESLADREVRAP